MADSSNLELNAINATNNVFNKAIGQESSLYNGPKYYFYNPLKVRGFAYFQDTIASPGNVYYDGVQHKGVELFYDLYKDDLITVLFDKNTYFSLLKEDVQNFDLLDHHFININADTLTNNSVIKSGYYDELYHGRSQVLVKITKVIEPVQISIGTPDAYSIFSKPIQEFFIRKNNVYYNINSEGELLDILKDRKKQLKNYLRANKIKFRKKPGPVLASVAAYYDSLSN
ncbi:MAG TPA: hypothetical protein VGI43_00795 [Mucilaginibacter sp.]|jgi:hypothetical protein